MHLTADVFGRLSKVEQRFNRLLPRFSAFVQALSFFSSSGCPLRGVTVVPSDEGSLCRVSFTTVSIDLRFKLDLSADGVAIGKVFCFNVVDEFPGVQPDAIGSFTFDGSGKTSFEVDGNEDPIDIVECACEIALHFIFVALRRS